MPRSFGRYLKLTIFLSGIFITVASAAFYVFCFIAIHVSTSLGSVSAAGSGRRLDARADGFWVGLATAAAWTFLVTALVVAISGSYTAWPVGVAFGLPVGVVVGWQVGHWQAAVSWSRSPGSFALGNWTGGKFLIKRPYTVTSGERLKHLVCTGPTGSGKTTLVRNLIVHDLREGSGLCVIDPKDDLIDGILPHIPESRLEDVILFDITDRERPLGLNPFAGVAPDQRSLAASELIAVFRRYFADAWGARLEHVLRNTVLALLEVPQATLLDIPRLLLDRSFSQWVVGQISNLAVREFFALEYEEVLRRRGDAIEPILNKVGPWLSYPELRDIIGQPQSSFDLRRVMDAGQILLVRVPQGAFGEDISNLLGALVVAKLQLAAQSRVNVAGAARRPFQLYVDEFQNFATSSFTKILTEARAFGLGVVCVNQYPEQLSRDLQLALTRNAATFVQTAYRRGRYLLEVTRQEDLNEKKPPVYVVTPPRPLPPGDPTRADRVRAVSRERYGRRPLDAAPIAHAAISTASNETIARNRDVELE